jgi:hypothetical protein
MHIIFAIMVVVNSAELRSSMKKYLNVAATETVAIQRGETETFALSKQERTPDDLSRAITGDELLRRLIPRLEKLSQK